VHLLQTKMQALRGRNGVGKSGRRVFRAVSSERRSKALQDGYGIALIGRTNLDLG
jgi:hypothetical protein